MNSIFKGKMGAFFTRELIARREMKAKFLIFSRWGFEHYDRYGFLKEASQKDVENCCTAEGLTRLLNVMFHEAQQITEWYILLFGDNYTPLDGDTYAVPGFTELTDYDETTRPAFVEAEAVDKVMTNNANKATFTMNADTNLWGSGVVGGGSPANGKGDTAGGGVLYAAAKWATAKPVEIGDTFKVRCILTSSDVV